MQPVTQMLGPAAFARLEPPPSARFERDARHMDGRSRVSHDLSFLECAVGLSARGRCLARTRRRASIKQFGEMVMGDS